MKLQRSTLILLLLALSLGGFVYFYEVQGASQRKLALAKQQQIFSFEEEQVQSFTVKTKQQTLEIERGDKSGKPIWRMKAPSKTPASDASVSYLINLLVNGKSDRTIQVGAAQLQEYGLSQPQATIEVKLKNQKTHQLILGKPDFNRNFLYAQANPPGLPAGNVNVLLVSTDFENAVNRPLSEWKSEVTNKGETSLEATPKALDKPSPSASP